MPSSTGVTVSILVRVATFWISALAPTFSYPSISGRFHMIALTAQPAKDAAAATSQVVVHRTPPKLSHPQPQFSLQPQHLLFEFLQHPSFCCCWYCCWYCCWGPFLCPFVLAMNFTILACFIDCNDVALVFFMPCAEEMKSHVTQTSAN